MKQLPKSKDKELADYLNERALHYERVFLQRKPIWTKLSKLMASKKWRLKSQ